MSSSAAGDIPSDPTALGDEIARTAAHLDAANHRLLTCIRLFDASEAWGHQGAVSCAHWLSWRLRLGPVAAREKVRMARALGELPLIDDALRRGVLSYSQVRALTRVATPTNEEGLLAIARSTTGAQLERVCRTLRRATRQIEGQEHPDETRTFREETLENGMVRLTIVLHPDEAALVEQAMDRARYPAAADGAPSAVVADDGRAPSLQGPEERRDGDAAASAEAAAAAAGEGGFDPRLSPGAPSAGTSYRALAKRSALCGSGDGPALIGRADALVSMAEAYLGGGDARLAPGAQIVVHLDQDPLAPDGTRAATLDDGTRLSTEALRRLSCDASVLPVHHSGQGTHLDLGRRSRIVPPALRRALSLRDRGCRFPACPHHFFLHAHHIVHWAHGGATRLSNLVLLCSAHHRLLHEGGFRIEFRGDGHLAFTDGRGTLIDTVPAIPDLEGDGLSVVSGWNEGAGLAIDATTGLPGWDGERIDYLWAVDAVLRE